MSHNYTVIVYVQCITKKYSPMVLANEIHAIKAMCCILLQVRAAALNVLVMWVYMSVSLSSCFLTFDLQMMYCSLVL